MKEEFQMLCTQIVEAWDRDGDVAPIIDKMRMYLAVAPRKKTASGPSRSNAIPPLPAFSEPYREQLQSWWEMRKLHHKSKAVNVLSARTIKALENANDLGVLKEFCDLAAESSWLSLGFPGHTEMLEKLAQDKKFKPGVKQSKFDRYPDNANNPAYKPLVIDTGSDVFF